LFLFGSTGVACSVLAAFSCEFLTFEVINGSEEEMPPPPFELAVKASVGLFKYDIQSASILNSTVPPGRSLGDISTNGDNDDGQCLMYENGFGQFDGHHFCLAQIASVVAPLLGIGGLIWAVAESVFCYSPIGWIPVSLVFVTGAGLQATTILAYVGDDKWCPDCDLELEMGEGMLLSALALTCFCVCAILECVSPVTDPCYFATRMIDENPPDSTITTTRKKKKRSSSSSRRANDAPIEQDERSRSSSLKSGKTGHGSISDPPSVISSSSQQTGKQGHAAPLSSNV
jgi:hypothetical protein